MERDGIYFPFQYGKKRPMINENEKLTADEAREALESVTKMESAGWRRAVPERWFGAGIATLIGSLFAVYALEDPYPYIVFPIIGIAVLIASGREKVGAYGRDFPDGKSSKLMLALFTVVLFVIFFGSIFIRRTYDAPWVSVIVGLLVGLAVFLASEHERRAYIAKAGGGQE
jgi:hypothetical protein